MSAQDSRFLTIRQVALLTTYSRASVYRLIANDSGFPSPLKMVEGGKVLFERSEVENWLASRRRAITRDTSMCSSE